MGAQRVLVVDDDPDYRLLVRLALAPDSGFEVVAEAGDGGAAVAEARRERPDLVLLDCTLPGADAFDILPALRAAVPDARIVLVSGHDPADLRSATRSAGAVGYLTKETPARSLAAELDALIGLVGAVEQLLSEASQRFDQDAQSPRAARRFVTQALTGWDDDEGDLTDTVTLLVSELVTNAVLHAGSDVEVMVRLTSTAARIEVTDASAESIAPRDATSEEDSGRGLALVGTLAQRWGVRTAPGGGKTVWFEVGRFPGEAPEPPGGGT
ncbi:MAG TPA: response regulator [Acidimicrobiia bacterium]|nr:response regulator [Acidimicrobiia bacterium]